MYGVVVQIVALAIEWEIYRGPAVLDVTAVDCAHACPDVFV